VELMVSSGLVLVFMGLIWGMLQAGSRFYLKVRGQTDVQKNALLALRWISKDLAEGAPLSFRHYSPEHPTVPSVHDGIVFGSPKDLDGRVHYDESGNLLWTSVIGIYIDPVSKTLYRTKYALPDHLSVAPQIDDSVHHVDLLAEIPERRKLAENIVKIETIQGPGNVRIKLRCRNEELGFGLSVQTLLEMKNS